MCFWGKSSGSLCSRGCLPGKAKPIASIRGQRTVRRLREHSVSKAKAGFPQRHQEISASAGEDTGAFSLGRSSLSGRKNVWQEAE